MNSTTKTFTGFVAGIAIGCLVTFVSSPMPLSADVRKAKPPVAFKSGGERSVEVLEKISKQIATMDERLAAIESSVVVKLRK